MSEFRVRPTPRTGGPKSSAIREQVRGMGVYLGGWTLVTIYILSAQLFLMRQPIYSDTFLRFTGLTLVRNYGWCLLTLLTLVLLRTFPLHRGATAWTWTVHLFGSMGITMLGMGMMASVIPLFYTPRLAFLPRTWAVTKQNFHFAYVIYYWGFVGLHEGIQLFRHLREKREVSLRLRSELATAQLRSLETHLGPHFLFNSLNTVAALIHSDPRAADQLLLKLSNLLRTGLNRSDDQWASLREELDYLESYLAIERLRLGARLQVEVCAPRDLWNAQVPAFLLQPLVEQTISRCVTPRTRGGRVDLRIGSEGGLLLIEVESGGSCAGADPLDQETTMPMAARLELLYGTDQNFAAMATPAGGILFRIHLPLKLNAPALATNGEFR